MTCGKESLIALQDHKFIIIALLWEKLRQQKRKGVSCKVTGDFPLLARKMPLYPKLL